MNVMLSLLHMLNLVAYARRDKRGDGRTTDCSLVEATADGVLMPLNVNRRPGRTTMMILERAAAWLFPARWLFWIWIVPGVVNGVALRLVDIDLRSRYVVEYVLLSVIATWFGLATSSLIYWFAPARGADPRPLHRRLYRFAVIYPVVSTLLFYAIGSAYLWMYIQLHSVTFQQGL